MIVYIWWHTVNKGLADQLRTQGFISASATGAEIKPWVRGCSQTSTFSITNFDLASVIWQVYFHTKNLGYNFQQLSGDIKDLKVQTYACLHGYLTSFPIIIYTHAHVFFHFLCVRTMQHVVFTTFSFIIKGLN